MIKILHIVLDMDLGGLQRIVSLIIRKIDKVKYNSYLCCLDRGGLFTDQITLDSAQTYRLNRKPGPFDVRMFIKLIGTLKKNKIDIIHSHNGCSMYAALAGRLCGVKGIIHTDHGRLVPDRKTAIWEDRLASYMMDRFVGVSSQLTEYLASDVKVNKKKLTTIVNGVDSAKFVPFNNKERTVRRMNLGFNPDAKIIGTVCRLDPIKNLSMLIECIPEIVRIIPDCQVIILGDGPDEKNLKDLARRLNLNSRIIFLGRVANVEMVMPLFDLYVNTSLSEGTSMTILEAMSCGLPVVASAVGGNTGLVDKSNGAVFPHDRADLFQKSVVSLLSNPIILEKMGKESRERVVRRFSINRVVEQYENLYLTLMNN